MIGARTSAAVFFPVDLRVKACSAAVLLPTQAPKRSAVDGPRLLSGVYRRQMDLSDIDSGGLGAFRLVRFFDLVLTPKLVPVAVPPDLNALWLLARRRRNVHRTGLAPSQ